MNLSRDKDVKKLIFENMSNIQDELEISSKGTLSMILQDVSLADSVADVLNLAVDMRVGPEGNDVDRAEILNALTSDEVSGNVILEGIVNFGNQGCSFFKRWPAN